MAPLLGIGIGNVPTLAILACQYHPACVIVCSFAERSLGNFSWVWGVSPVWRIE